MLSQQRAAVVEIDMNTCNSVHVLVMAIGLLGCLGLSGCGDSGGGGGGSVTVASTRADGKKMSADDRAAADFVRSKLEEHWTKNADGWTTQYQAMNVFGQVVEGVVPDILFRQYREFKYTVDPEELTESMKLNGTDYRASVPFEGTPERLYRPQATFDGPQGWSNWRDGFPTFALAVERRNGTWIVSSDSLFDGIKPTEAVPAGN
jgi:hypothetical protein